MLKRLADLIRSEPALIAIIGQAIVAFFVAHHHPLTTHQAGAIEAAVAAVAGFIVAGATQPFRKQALAGLATAALTLLAAFGFHLSSAQVAVGSAVAAAIMMVIHSLNTVPATPLSGADPRAGQHHRVAAREHST